MFTIFTHFPTHLWNSQGCSWPPARPSAQDQAGYEDERMIFEAGMRCHGSCFSPLSLSRSSCSAMSRALSCLRKPWLGRMQRRWRTCSMAATTERLCFVIRYARTRVADLLRPITQWTSTLSRVKWSRRRCFYSAVTVGESEDFKGSRVYSVADSELRGWTRLRDRRIGRYWKWVCRQLPRQSTGCPGHCSNRHRSTRCSTSPPPRWERASRPAPSGVLAPAPFSCKRGVKLPPAVAFCHTTFTNVLTHPRCTRWATPGQSVCTQPRLRSRTSAPGPRSPAWCSHCLGPLAPQRTGSCSLTWPHRRTWLSLVLLKQFCKSVDQTFKSTMSLEIVYLARRILHKLLFFYFKILHCYLQRPNVTFY